MSERAKERSARFARVAGGGGRVSERGERAKECSSVSLVWPTGEAA